MKWLACCLAFVLVLPAPPAFAEQFIQIGDYQAHYMILDSLSLEPEIAKRYGITRASTSSILTLSILDADGASVPARVEGTAINLLGNARGLRFQAIQEGEAHYMIASIRHTEEQMRFELTIGTPDGATQAVKFEQKLYPGMP